MTFSLVSAGLLGDGRHAREQCVLDELDQAFDHLRLAGEVSIQGGLRQTNLLSEFGGGDFAAGVGLQHARQRLQYFRFSAGSRHGLTGR